LGGFTISGLQLSDPKCRRIGHRCRSAVHRLVAQRNANLLGKMPLGGLYPPSDRLQLFVGQFFVSKVFCHLGEGFQINSGIHPRSITSMICEAFCPTGRYGRAPMDRDRPTCRGQFGRESSRWVGRRSRTRLAIRRAEWVGIARWGECTSDLKSPKAREGFFASFAVLGRESPTTFTGRGAVGSSLFSRPSHAE
jgi:hypothetical protein